MALSSKHVGWLANMALNAEPALADGLEAGEELVLPQPPWSR